MFFLQIIDGDTKETLYYQGKKSLGQSAKANGFMVPTEPLKDIVTEIMAPLS